MMKVRFSALALAGEAESDQHEREACELAH
jgi:hypothetical protein